MNKQRWQNAVNKAYAELLMGAAMEAGLVEGPKVDVRAIQETLVLGLAYPVIPQKAKIIEIMADSIESGDLGLSRQYAERVWEKYGDLVVVEGY